MSSMRGHRVGHTVPVAAPAGVVYGVLADAARWPVLLSSHVHVERLDFDGDTEHLREWEVTGGGVRASRTRRVLDARSRVIEFEQRYAPGPGAWAAGAWSVEAQDTGRCLLTLRQDLPRDGSTGTAGEVEAQVRGRLERVRRVAEQWETFDELLLSFEDGVLVNGPAELVYDFLYRAGEWAETVPHVDWTSVSEDQPGVQLAVMDTCAGQTGEPARVEAVRLCFPHAGRIVFKDTRVPGPIAAHAGEWYLLPTESGVRAGCVHHVLLGQEDVARALGEDATLADARRQVREWLGRASTEALGLAKWHAESAVCRLR
ncbi:aromatase/cyclase [Streptomyces brasiliensis]|uniref:Aromatase n=1 Tax=Streptomyces brasiliensis TaxID=1954 RepID=A0A917L4N7_9ACTN|nr:SRPBCC family protein [Streptomyces brasiliensis]GGJ44505.1 hypothetical protein GCM10010121_064630 [Streptomyces brasiliensis]